MAELRKHEETVRRFQEMFAGSLDKEVIQRVLQKHYYDAESSLLELLEIAESHREKKSVETRETNPPISPRSEHYGNSSQFSQLPQTSPENMRSGAFNQQLQQPEGGHRTGTGSAGPAGRSEYRPQVPHINPNPSAYNPPYARQSDYLPPNLSSAPQGYPHQLYKSSEQRIRMGDRVDTKGGISQQYSSQFPTGQDQAKKPRVEHNMSTTQGPMRPSVGGSDQQRGNVFQAYRNEEMERAMFGQQTGGSLHRSSVDIGGEGRRWHWSYSNSSGRNSDRRRSWQDSGSGGKLLIIIRGLPGSGKTTLARQLAGSGGRILSTDDFFCSTKGRYMYDVTRIGEAHDWNQKRAQQAMASGESPVVIDNTNCMRWEMKPYVKSARRYGYRVELHEPETDWKFNPKELARRNVHGVPLEKIKQMLDRYEHNVSVDSIFDQPPRPVSSLSRTSRTHNRTPSQKSEEKGLVSLPMSMGKSDSGMTSLGQMPSFNPALLRSGSNSPTVDQQQTKEKLVASQLPQQTMKEKVVPHMKEGVDELRPLESSDRLNVQEVKEGGSPLSTHLSSSGSLSGSGQSGQLTGLSTGELKPPAFNSSLLSFRSNPMIVQPPNVNLPTPPHQLSFETLGNVGQLREQLRASDLSTDPQAQSSNVPISASPLQLSSHPAGSAGSMPITSLPRSQMDASPMDPTSSTAATNTINNSNPSQDNDANRQPSSIESQRPSGEGGGQKHQRPLAARFPVPMSAPPPQSFPSHRLSALDSVSPPESTTSMFNSLQRQGSSSSIPVRLTGNQSVIATLNESLRHQVTARSGGLSNEEFIEMLKTELDNQPDETADELLDHTDGRDYQADDEYKEFTRLLSDVKRNTASMSSRVIERDLQHSPSYDSVQSNAVVSATESAQVSTAPGGVELGKSQAAGLTEKAAGSESNHDSERWSHTSDKPSSQRREKSVDQHGNNGSADAAGLAMEVVSIAAHGIEIPVYSGLQLVSEGSGNSRVDERSLSPHSLLGDRPSISPTRTEKGPVANQKAKALPAVDTPEFCSSGLLREKPNESHTSSLDRMPHGQPNVDSIATEATGGNKASGVSDNPRTQPEHPNIVSSLDFLMSCFPDLCRHEMRELLQQNQYNVELAINVVLQQQAAELPQHRDREQISEASDSDESMGDVSGKEDGIVRQKDVEDDPEEQESSELQGVITGELDAEIANSLDREGQGKTPDDASASADLLFEGKAVSGGSKSVKRKKKQQIHNDEKIARKLQAELDSTVLSVDNPADSSSMAAVAHPLVGAEGGEERKESQEDAATLLLAGKMCLRLDERLVQQMQLMFGQVPFPLTAEDYVVDLGEKFARKLYRKWQAGLEEKYDFEGTHARRLLKEDENLAKKLQAEEEKLREEEMVGNKPIHHRRPQRQDDERKASHGKRPAEPFTQILDEQLAVELGKQERAGGGKRADMATDIKRQQLYAMYPSIERATLDDIFSANDFAIGQTVDAIKASCDLEPKQTSMSAEILPSLSKSANEIEQHFRNPQRAGPEVYQQTMYPDYEDFRAEAGLHAQQREDCLRKAAQAFQQKRGDIAQYYSQQACLHAEKMREANRRASQLILSSRNVGNQPLECVDLHGLHVSEGLETLKDTLACIEAVEPSRRPHHLTVVTGRGRHSEGGKARLKPAVKRYLTQHGHRFSEPNAGTIRINL